MVHALQQDLTHGVQAGPERCYHTRAEGHGVHVGGRFQLISVVVLNSVLEREGRVYRTAQGVLLGLGGLEVYVPHGGLVNDLPCVYRSVFVLEYLFELW